MPGHAGLYWPRPAVATGAVAGLLNCGATVAVYTTSGAGDVLLVATCLDAKSMGNHNRETCTAEGRATSHARWPSRLHHVLQNFRRAVTVAVTVTKVK